MADGRWLRTEDRRQAKRDTTGDEIHISPPATHLPSAICYLSSAFCHYYGFTPIGFGG